MPDAFTDQLEQLRIVPVVVLNDAKNADPLGEALVAGGLPCAEVTFRTDAARASIETLAKRGDLLVGAGTVLSADQVKAAQDAGAQFVVSPGFNPKTVQACLDAGLPIFPGVSNPTDIEMAIDMGLRVVKFFPAEAFGGVKTLKAIAAPYKRVRFVPTGGIGAGNLLDYLNFKPVLACGGSWMVKADLIDAGDFNQITALTQEAVALAASI